MSSARQVTAASRCPSRSSTDRSEVCAVAGPAGNGAAEAAEEKTEFDVVLKEVGAEKIKVIKVVRELTGLGLKEAKDVVDGAPSKVKEGITKEEADKIVAAFKEVGAVCEVK